MECGSFHQKPLNAATGYPMCADDNLLVDNDRDPGIKRSSTLKKSTQTVKSSALDSGMKETVDNSFNILSVAFFSKLYAFHVRPRIEYGEHVTSLCTTTELGVGNCATVNHTALCRISRNQLRRPIRTTKTISC